MKFRRAVFIVVYAIVKNKPQYLILKRHLHWKGWEFPKGGIEPWEIRRLTIKRELNEETGLNPIKIKSFNEKGKYKYVKKYSDRPGVDGQTYKLYAVKVAKGKVNFDKREHADYKWVNFKTATAMLTWENQRRCLGVVDGWLSKLY